MLKFQEESLRQSVNGALALRHQINPFLDAIFCFQAPAGGL